MDNQNQNQPVVNNQAPSVDNQKPTPKGTVIGKYRIEIDQELCLGDGTCAALSPVFKLNDKGKSEIVPGVTDTEENILQAAQACPASAIIITDVETGEQVWPK